MALTAPTGPYRPQSPPAFALQQYLPWFINEVVRLGRDNGYSNLVDDGLVLLLREYGLTAPAGGFVDSDGRNARGQLVGRDADGRDADGYDRNGYNRDGFTRDGVNANGQTREQYLEAMVAGWDTDTAAQVLANLADRIA